MYEAWSLSILLKMFEAPKTLWLQSSKYKFSEMAFGEKEKQATKY